MSIGGFTFKIRTQFSFIVDDPTLSSILSGIAKQEINITGYLQTKLFAIENNSTNNLSSSINVVRAVVGNADSENSSDLLGTRKVLDCLGVEFQEKSVIQIVDAPPGIPGLFNSIFGALWCKVIVNAMYIGEEDQIFIDASDIFEAILILSQTPLKQCPKHYAKDVQNNTDHNICRPSRRKRKKTE